MYQDDREIVSALRKRLAEKLGRNLYEVWFPARTQLLVQGQTLVIRAPQQFIVDWLRSHFRKELTAVCEEVLSRALEIEFQCSAAPVVEASEPSEVASPVVAETPVAAPVDPSPADACNSPLKLVCEPQTAPASSAHVSARRRFASLGSFVVGDSNCVAWKAAELAAEQPGKMSPLVVHGPTGIGKTHLLEGVWSAFKKKHRHARAVYLSAEQFTTYFLEALRGSGLPSFRRKYRDVELLIIDDVQFFSGKRATLVELQHTIDAMLQAGRQLVLAADRAPAALKSLGPEIENRLAGGVICRIDPPDYQTRRGIVRQLAAQLGINLPDDVQAFISSRLTSHARELSGALKRLQATSLAHEKPISLALAEDALADLIHHTGSMVRLPDIEKAVCTVFGLAREDLQSNRKSKTVSHPRMLAMWLARKHTRAALSEIGTYFGRRSHSTVISANHKIDAWMTQGSPLDFNGRPLSLDEAIRRVEENLRAG